MPHTADFGKEVELTLTSWGFNAFKQIWPLESKQQQQNVQSSKGEKAFSVRRD